MKHEHRQFYRDVLSNLQSNSLAVFAGAGLSKSAGYVDWKGLLREIAEDLGLSVDIETDLISLAQYNANKMHGRSVLNQKLLEEFTADAESTENHKILCRLPVYTYWTTNYDYLLENGLKEQGRIADVKHSVHHLSLSKPRRDAIVYKMHGDASSPNDAVLTKDDYERYYIDKAPFVTALSGDLLSKLFLFIGFSFTDPNLDYILSRVRIEMKNTERHHYYFIKKVAGDDPDIKDKADFEYKTRKQQYFIDDLARFKLQPVFVDTYQEITQVLHEIENLYKKKTVFIGGSAEIYDPFTGNESQAFIHKLSSAIIREQFRIVNGFGWGVGSAVINGALEAIHGRPERFSEDQLIIKPFPQFETGSKTLPELWHDYRTKMLSYAGIALFVFGNKKKGTDVVPADGLEKEFKIAREQQLFLLPLPGTGYMSKILFDGLVKEGYYESKPGMQKLIESLSAETDLDKMTGQVIKIIQHINKQ